MVVTHCGYDVFTVKKFESEFHGMETAGDGKGNDN